MSNPTNRTCALIKMHDCRISFLPNKCFAYLRTEIIKFFSFLDSDDRDFRISGQILDVREESTPLERAPGILYVLSCWPCGNRTRYCTLTMVYACKNLSVVTMKDLWKKKERGGFLFHSHSSHLLPMNKGKIHMTGFTSAVCTSAVLRSRQERRDVCRA